MLARAGDEGSGGQETLSGAGASAQGGSNSDSIYDEVLRRLREEQEQLGQLIHHPF